jgi:hypothetical protein
VGWLFWLKGFRRNGIGHVDFFSRDRRSHPYPDGVIRISCEACGWVAITSQPVNDVWREHETGCPAVGGAVRHLPDLPPLRRLLPPVTTCRHRPVRRQIAVTAAGVKKYAVMCEFCGRLVG